MTLAALVGNKAMRNGIVLEFKCLCEIAEV